jgi:aspartate/tyrosine/aromatic aminotransferase
MLAAGYNKEYLPIEGLEGFRKATVQLLLGADHPAIKDNRVAVVQVRRQVDGARDVCIGGATALSCQWQGNGKPVCSRGTHPFQ